MYAIALATPDRGTAIATSSGELSRAALFSTIPDDKHYDVSWITQTGKFYWCIHEIPFELCIHEIPFKEGVLRRHQPITLFAYPSYCGEYVDVDFQDVGMELTFSKEDNIQEGLEDIFCMKWRRYAMGNPQKMTPLAQSIRGHLLKTYRYFPS